MLWCGPIPPRLRLRNEPAASPMLLLPCDSDTDSACDSDTDSAKCTALEDFLSPLFSHTETETAVAERGRAGGSAVTHVRRHHEWNLPLPFITIPSYHVRVTTTRDEWMR